MAHTGLGASDFTLKVLEYNPASQITKRNITQSIYMWSNLSGVSDTYTRNGLNQYETAGGATLSYDANGNLDDDGGSPGSARAILSMTRSTVWCQRRMIR